MTAPYCLNVIRGERSDLFAFFVLEETHGRFAEGYYRGANAGNRFLVIYCRRNGQKVNRMGLTVSTKLGHAVVRNRVRRRLREIVRLNEDKLAEGFDFVIVARSAAVEAEFSALTKAFLTLTDKLGMQKKQP